MGDEGSERCPVADAQERVEGALSAATRETQKILSNFFVVNVAGSCELRPKSNDKIWVWWAFYCSDREPKVQRLALS